MALEHLVHEQITAGIDYIVALGSTAEAATLSDSERKAVVSCIRTAVGGRRPLVVGIGGNHTQKVVETVRTFDFSGIDGILSVVPYYNKPSQEGIFRHFKAIAEASPVPVILYDVPSRTGVKMLADTTLRLAAESRRIVAVKEASGDLEQVSDIVAGQPDHFRVISGDDALIVPIAARGGGGVISVAANAIPAKIRELTALALTATEQAPALQHQLDELCRLLFAEGNPTGIKALMEILGKAANILRLPLCPASPELYHKLELCIKNLLP